MEQNPPYQYPINTENLQEILPTGPGVYLFKDDKGRTIYVGKAKNLKKRVLTYLKPPQELSHKTGLMMRRAAGLDFILTSSEKEALILESTLIKKFLPRYNIVLRDDSQYPCLRLSLEDTYPRLSIARKIKKDGAKYFGPFSSAGSVRQTLKVIDRVFQLRKCKGRDVPERSRPCLNFQMGRCMGPCAGKVTKKEYGEIVKQVILFLEGKNRELITELKKRMDQASESLEFEKAARIRDQIRAIEKTIEKQHVVFTRMEDQDIIGLSQRSGIAQIVVLMIRKGYLLGSRDYAISTKKENSSEVMEAFLKQYYFRETFVPREILISHPISDTSAIEEWLSEHGGLKVSIHCPQRGEKKNLIEIAISNAVNLLEKREIKKENELTEMMQRVLRLKNPPRHVEGLDISNLQGNQAVGTIVSFVDGMPMKSGYRNYRIKTVEGIDDYAMMGELITRRLNKGRLPDLFVIDGGKGQLAVVKRALDNFKDTDPPEIVAIAKADPKRGEVNDKIFIVGRKNPLALASDNPVLLFLMKVRDEAHRRAIRYHKNLRKKQMTDSLLTQIPGVGKKRQRILLTHFKGVNGIKKATEEELANIPGISGPVAKSIVQFFKEMT